MKLGRRHTLRKDLFESSMALVRQNALGAEIPLPSYSEMDIELWLELL